jgi:hypothetical protein
MPLLCREHLATVNEHRGILVCDDKVISKELDKIEEAYVVALQNRKR